MVHCAKEVFHTLHFQDYFFSVWIPFVSIFYVCMYVSYMFLIVFSLHLADRVNLCGNSGAAIYLPAPVSSGLTSNMKGFVCLGRKALSIVRFVALCVCLL